MTTDCIDTFHAARRPFTIRRDLVEGAIAAVAIILLLPGAALYMSALGA